MAIIDVDRALADAIDTESRVGIRWWAGAEMAPIARRRWCSFARRHPKRKSTTTNDRVLDLAKGLQAHFEPDTLYTPMIEWIQLSAILAKVLERGDGN